MTALAVLGNYRPQKKPWAKQGEALAAMGFRESFALLMAMRCVDSETEYLSPEGWRKISEYKKGKVAEFRLDGTAAFVDPLEFIKSKVDKFWHFKTQGGVDQVLSDNHRVLLCSREVTRFGKLVGKVPPGFRKLEKRDTDFWRETSPAELVKTKRKLKDHVPTSFFLKTDTKIDMTDNEIKLMVAFHADGTLGYNPIRPSTKKYGYIRIKKDRKKLRLRSILRSAEIEYSERKAKPDGFSIFKFVPPRLTKFYGQEWWKASNSQRELIADEVCLWDGFVDGETRTHRDNGTKKYSSRHEGDVDFIQYCFASTGHRTSKIVTKGRMRPYRGEQKRQSAIAQVTVSGFGRTNNLALLPAPKPYKGGDGFMYSFSVPSTYLVLRRGGKVFVTGNTGKTKVLLDNYGSMELAGLLNDLLVIAPAGVYETWRTAFLEHAAPDLINRSQLLLWRAGSASGAARRRETSFLDWSGPRVLIMDVEALSSVQRAQDLLREFLRREGRKKMTAVDESTTIKNIDSNRGAFVSEVVRPLSDFRRILSGLPSPRSPLDLFGQFYFLDPEILGFENYKGFEARYAKIEQVCMLPDKVLRARLDRFLSGKKMIVPGVGRFDASDLPRSMVIDTLKARKNYIPTVPILKNYMNEEELRDRIQPHSFRCLLTDCYDVPPKLYSFWDVEMHPEQRRVYKELREMATAELESQTHVTATQVIVKMLRLHQILCGHVRDEEGTIQEIPELRTRAVCQILDDYDGKAIVWASYDHSVQKIYETLEKKFGEGSTARFWGGNRGSREKEEARFLSEPRCRHMVATPAAGGRGRTWTIANLLIYYSNTNNLEHRSQSEERGDAHLKMDRIACVDLRTQGTVDEKIIYALRDKMDMSAKITGDNWREWLI